MNILYLNHYAGSPLHGMEYRPYYLAKEWVKQGHQVCVVAASFSHLRLHQPKTNDKNVVKKTYEKIDGIDYIWYPTPSYIENGFGRVKNILCFLKQVWLDARNLVKKYQPDVVIASSTYPMDIWVAKRIAKIAGAKLVFEIHDLWPLSPIELGGMSPKHPFIQWCQWAENTAYKASDVVVSILPNVHGHTKEHGLDLEKLVIIPNGIVEEDWQAENIQPLDEGELAKFLLDQKAQGKVIVGYAGAHGIPNALEYLLDAAKELQENKNIVIVLIGSGLEKEKLIDKKNKENIDNVYFFDGIPKLQIPSFLAAIDIAYIGFQKQSLYRFGVSPNKIMDYMFSAKPILCSLEAANDWVGDTNCGITVRPADEYEIAQGILALSQLSDEERTAMGQNGRDFILNNQTYSILSDKFLKAIS